MIKLSDNKVIIINERGEYTTYSKKNIRNQEDCIKEFSKKIKHPGKNVVDLTKRGFVIFLVDDEKVDAYMPSSLSDYQLYELDLLCISMDEVKCMNVYKKSSDEVFNLVGNVDDKFSSEVIQSYYEKPKQKVK